jgi:SAM-dependent methyltransferase
MAIWSVRASGDPAPASGREPLALVDLGQRLAATPEAAWDWIARLQSGPGPRHRGEARRRGAVATPVGIAARMARALLARTPRGATLRVLDAGCGTGRLLGAVAREASRRRARIDCTGIEIDAAAARWAQALEPVAAAGARGALAAWRVRRMDFLLDDFSLQFDAAIANPPYVSWRDLEPRYRDRLRSRNGGAPGDLAALFVGRLLDRLRPGGRLCVIVPNKLLATRYAARLRARLLAETTLEEIWDLSRQRIFPGRASYPVVLVARRVAASRRHRVVLRDADGTPRARWPQIALRALPSAVVPLGLEPELGDLALRLLSGRRFGDAVRARCGIATSGFGRAVGSGPETIVRSGDVRPFRLSSGARFAPRRAGLAAAALERMRRPKVVVPGMFRRLCAAYDGERRLLGRVYFVPVDGGTAAAREARRAVLLALLNSRLYALLYAGLFAGVAQSGGWMRLNAPYLECMPWPRRAPDARLLSAVARCERRRAAAADLERLDLAVEALFDLGRAESRLLARLARRLPADR